METVKWVSQEELQAAAEKGSVLLNKYGFTEEDFDAFCACVYTVCMYQIQGHIVTLDEGRKYLMNHMQRKN